MFPLYCELEFPVQTPLIISMGMSSLSGVRKIHDLMRVRFARTNFALLHCTSAYPTQPEDANINVAEPCTTEKSPFLKII